MTAPGQATGQSLPFREEPLKLLFVDDDPILREFALLNLAGSGAVAVAANGEAALASIGADRPDLVLLDLHMPKLDGFEVLRRLRAAAATQGLPVIVITGCDDVASIDRAFSLGATSFLVKPINWRQLSYQIRYVNRARRTELSLIEHIAEVKRREQQQQATAAELVTAWRGAAAASEAKAQFLSAMSHELRTPLNAVIGFSQLLDAETFGPLGNARYREYAHDILGSGQHLLSLVERILDYADGSGGDQALAEEEFSPAELVEEAVALLRPQAAAKQMTLAIHAAPAALSLCGDRAHVQRILVNLLGNAVKFTPPGGRITTRLRHSGEGLAIAVSDTGIGIAAEDIPKILEHFGRVDDSFARRYEGVGLGLSVARRFVELHGGTLVIESALDVGTTVTVTFPASRVRLKAAA